MREYIIYAAIALTSIFCGFGWGYCCGVLGMRKTLDSFVAFMNVDDN